MGDGGRTTPRVTAVAGATLALVIGACTASPLSGTPRPNTVPSVPNLSSSGSGAPLTWPTITLSSATVPAQLDLGILGFWTLEQPMAAADLSLNYLRVGTLDGQVRLALDLHNPGIGPVNLPLQPQPVGPAGGRMLYVVDNGHQATLHAVSVTSGADISLGTTPAFIAVLAIDPTGSTAYAVGLDRTSGAFVEVDAIPTVNGRPRPIIRARDLPPGATAPYAPVPGISYHPRLAVSIDGRWVALASCRPSGCDLVGAPTGGGSLQIWPGFAFDERIIGVAGNLLIGSTHSCEEAVCDGFVVDLRSGIRSSLGGAENPFDPKQLIAGPHGPLVLGDGGDYAKGDWRVEALDLTDRTRSTIFAGSFEPGYTIVRLAEWRQAELPPGWFLIYRNADAAPDPYPDYTAGTIGGTAEVPLPVMSFPRT